MKKKLKIILILLSLIFAGNFMSQFVQMNKHINNTFYIDLVLIKKDLHFALLTNQVGHLDDKYYFEYYISKASYMSLFNSAFVVFVMAEDIELTTKLKVISELNVIFGDLKMHTEEKRRNKKNILYAFKYDKFYKEKFDLAKSLVDEYIEYN